MGIRAFVYNRRSYTIRGGGSFEDLLAFSDEVLHIFIATGLTAGQTNPDDDEFVNTKKLSFDKAMDLVKKGKIRDSKTLIALLYYKTFCLK